MPVVDSLLNEEKIEQLLAEGGESETLDYKRTLDLSETCDLVELAKDIAAMQVNGGYIVVGADDNGKPTGELTEAQVKLFDESRLRSKLLKYLPAPFHLQSCVYEREGNWIAAIVTQPNPSGFMIMKADGQYGVGKSNTIVFRKGDIFVRHGTASERWLQHDIERIMKRITAAHKEEWRRENTEAFVSIIQAEASAKTIRQGSAASFTWRIDAQAFDDALIELLRADDRLPVRMLLDRMSQDAATLISSHEGDPLEEMRTLLNRLACLSANFLRFGKDDLSALSIRTFVQIYSYGFDVEGNLRSRGRDNPLNTPRLWIEIIERIVALGAYAVRLEEWEALRSLTLKIPQDSTFFYYGDTTPWIRNAITRAAQANLFAHPQTNVTSMGELISLAKQVADSQPCLRPDLIAGDDQLLNSILQFDLLSVLVVSYRERRFDPSHAYPSFIFWDARRSEPALIKLLSETKAQIELFGEEIDEIDLAVLADILRTIDKVGDQRNIRWDNWRSKAVVDFLNQHPLPAE